MRQCRNHTILLVTKLSLQQKSLKRPIITESLKLELKVRGLLFRHRNKKSKVFR